MSYGRARIRNIRLHGKYGRFPYLTWPSENVCTHPQRESSQCKPTREARDTRHRVAGSDPLSAASPVFPVRSTASIQSLWFERLHRFGSLIRWCPFAYYSGRAWLIYGPIDLGSFELSCSILIGPLQSHTNSSVNVAYILKGPWRPPRVVIRGKFLLPNIFSLSSRGPVLTSKRGQGTGMMDRVLSFPSRIF